MRDMKAWKKTCACLLFLFSIAALLTFGAGAQGSETWEQMPSGYNDWLETLPPELLEHLPSSIFDTDTENVTGAVEEMSNFSYLLQTVMNLIGLRVGECAKLLASLCAILLISAIARTLQSAFRQETVSRAFGFCVTAVMIVALFSHGFSAIKTTVNYFENLNAFTAASIPLMGGLYAMGGNVSSAVSASVGLTLFMTVLEEFVGQTIIPFCGICLALSLVGALDPSLRVGTLLGSIKKNYTTALSFLMMLLLAMLGAQSVLSATKDTLAMRSAKFAAGNIIPVVGGSVAELLRSVSAGVGYLRGTVGVCGVLLLLFLLLPTLIELLLVRVTWQLGASFADLLGCDGEKRLFEEFASINGYLITAVAICSSVLFLSLILLIRCASAIA